LDNDAIVARGRQAKAILESKVLTEAFESAKQKYIQAWERTTPQQVDERESMYYALQALEMVRHELQVFSDDADKAVYDQQQRDKRAANKL
jgi:hypothetical protein